MERLAQLVLPRFLERATEIPENCSWQSSENSKQPKQQSQNSHTHANKYFCKLQQRDKNREKI